MIKFDLPGAEISPRAEKLEACTLSGFGYHRVYSGSMLVACHWFNTENKQWFYLVNVSTDHYILVIRPHWPCLKGLIYKNLQNTAEGGMAPRPMIPTVVICQHGMYCHPNCYTPSAAYIGFCRFLLRTPFKIQSKHFYGKNMSQMKVKAKLTM